MGVSTLALWLNAALLAVAALRRVVPRRRFWLALGALLVAAALWFGLAMQHYRREVGA